MQSEVHITIAMNRRNKTNQQRQQQKKDADNSHRVWDIGIEFSREYGLV